MMPNSEPGRAATDADPAGDAIGGPGNVIGSRVPPNSPGEADHADPSRHDAADPHRHGPDGAHRHSGHGHSHAHGHSHGIVAPPPGGYDRAFLIGLVLNIGYVVVEAAAGLATGSLALLADAGHNLSDVLGLALAFTGSLLGRIRPTRTRTYGWRSASILTAVANAMLLLVAVGAIATEAVRRIGDPPAAPGLTILIVAAVGVVINFGTAMLFFGGRHGDVNIRGAYLHMIADAAVSLAVVVGGAVILATGWAWIDPVASLLVAAVILWGTWGLGKESLNLALQAVPAGIDVDAVTEYLATRPGVTAVHDLHIWAISTTETALTAHLVRPLGDGAGEIADPDALLADLADEMSDRFGIGHVTVQVERDADVACGRVCNTPTAPPTDAER